ncbi:hypothetical protein D3C77_527620 [compost metagenome]
MPFLKAFVTTSHSFGMSDHIGKVNHSLSVKCLRDFVDLNTLSERFDAIDKSNFSDDEKALVAEFEKKRHQTTDSDEEEDW